MIATTGFFDGVHLGHQALLQRVVHLAHETGQESAVITFRPHPRQVLFHQHIPLLTSLEEKKKLITQQGIDQIFMIPFSPEFASLTAEEFFQTYLKQQYRISTLVVGKDHTLGSDKANLAQLQIIGAAFGIKVQSIDDVVENGHRISSTQLRKKALREKMLNARLALPSSQRATRTERITQTVVSLPLFQQASHLYTYLDYRNEVGTKAIIQHARTQGKKVAVPKVVGQEIQFYYLQSFEELIPGYQGILEPTSWILADVDHALILLPAVAVDTQGYRLGYGGGFYDKYLISHPNYDSLTLAFEIQVVDYLPITSFDQKVWMIVTEERIIHSDR